MKTTIKLLIGLLVLVTVILSAMNFEMAKQYAAIDTEDKYHEYEQFTDLAFQNIDINGGNELQVVIEKGEHNSLFIHNHFSDKIDYENKNGLLSLNFHEDLTADEFDTRQEDYYRISPSVYITYTELTNIVGTNGNIVVQSELNNQLSLNCQGNTKLILNIPAINGGNLSVEASNNSYVNISETAEKGSIPLAEFDMKDATFLKMKSLNADSIALKMSPESELNCGSSVVAKLN